MLTENGMRLKRIREKTWRENNQDSLKAIKRREYIKHREAYLRRAMIWEDRVKNDPSLQEEFRRAKREVKWRAKMQVIKLFGGKCQRCEFSDERALQIDHVNADPLPRKTGLRGGEKLYRAILAGKFPLEYFQLLCANCNAIKRFENGEGCIKRNISHPEIIPYRRKGWWVTREEKAESSRKMWEERRRKYGPSGRGQKGDEHGEVEEAVGAASGRGNAA